MAEPKDVTAEKDRDKLEKDRERQAKAEDRPTKPVTPKEQENAPLPDRPAVARGVTPAGRLSKVPEAGVREIPPPAAAEDWDPRQAAAGSPIAYPDPDEPYPQPPDVPYPPPVESKAAQAMDKAVEEQERLQAEADKAQKELDDQREKARSEGEYLAGPPGIPVASGERVPERRTSSAPKAVSASKGQTVASSHAARTGTKPTKTTEP